VPVVFLSAWVGDDDRVRGFEAGADDYVTKPFNLRELLLRLAAVLRRGAQPSELLVAGPIEIDRPRMIVRVAEAPVALTNTELRLLTFLAEASGRVRTRAELLHHVVGDPDATEARTIDTHVMRLRTKLGSAGELVETVRSVGYRLRLA
jgi:two-component system phosphate regulon response regulator PhoB